MDVLAEIKIASRPEKAFPVGSKYTSDTNTLLTQKMNSTGSLRSWSLGPRGIPSKCYHEREVTTNREIVQAFFFT